MAQARRRCPKKLCQKPKHPLKGAGKHFYFYNFRSTPLLFRKQAHVGFSRVGAIYRAPAAALVPAGKA